MTDYFGFTMASLNGSGSVFANPCKGEKSMSTLMYRPFSSWANNSEVRSFAFLNLIYVLVTRFWNCSPASVISSVNSAKSITCYKDADL